MTKNMGTSPIALGRPAPGRPATAAPAPRVQLRRIGLFCLTAFGLCWLACLPLWLGPGLSDAGQVLLCAGMAMFTPAVAALLTARLLERRPWRRAPRRPDGPGSASDAPERATVLGSLGLRVRGGAGRLVVALVVGLTAPVLLLLGSQLVAGLVGTADLDLTLARTATGLGAPADASLPQAWLVFTGRLLTVMALGGALNLVFALGEALGWRGTLSPRLESLWGRPAAVVVGGVVWGLWHAPLILLGYNYPDAPRWLGLVAMVVLCTGMGGILYWLTVRFGSVWPAALAHGVNNATAALIMAALLAPGASLDTVNGSALGWPGWVVYGAAVIVGLVAVRRRRLAFPADAETPTGPAAAPTAYDPEPQD